MSAEDTSGAQAREHWRGSEEAPPVQAAEGYGGFAPRPPGIFAITRGTVDVSTLPEPLQHVFKEFAENAKKPFVGVTTDGTVVEGLYPLGDTGISSDPIVEATERFIATLSDDERARVLQPVDSPEWRSWINAFAPESPDYGLLLDTASDEQRTAAMAVFETVLSAEGFEQLRDTMRINDALGAIAPGYEDTLREYMYWMTIFGTPSTEEPWGFQLFGHHISVNAFIVGTQLTVGPMFLGAEPRVVESGRFAGIRAFDQELQLAVAVMESMSPEQQQKARIAKSMRWEDLPPELAHPTEGRMRGAVARDNAVIPHEGVMVKDLSTESRNRIRTLIEHYVSRLPEGHAALKMAEIDAHLSETSFAWVGETEIDEPFYYKVQNDVFFTEADAHAGIFLSNDEPKPFHVHNVVRMPNGNDYGKAYLAQHRTSR